ncbi:MAG: glucan biosynthesis protein, partial [Rhizomicrobium sp.]
MIDRRFLLAAFAAAGALPTLPAFGAPKAAPAGLRFGLPHAFTYEGLRSQAQKLATIPYKSIAPPAKAIIEGVDFDKVQKIRFRPENTLWRGVAGADPIAF